MISINRGNVTENCISSVKERPEIIVCQCAGEKNGCGEYKMIICSKDNCYPWLRNWISEMKSMYSNM